MANPARLGETKPRPLDVRVIAATNQDLGSLVKEGRFREDLYYRLLVVPFHIPPLRERREDVPLLAQRFIEQAAASARLERVSITPTALKQLTQYDWPGNVRQLENMIERLVALSGGTEIDEAALPDEFRREPLSLGGLRMEVPDGGVDLEDVEKALIRLALERCNGNQTRAAQFLRLTRNTLLYRMDKYGLK